MQCISAAYAVVQCPSLRQSVRLSVTFVHSVEWSKHIFEIISPSDSYAILLFSVYQTLCKYSDGNPL